jgi:hypothetical protein
MSLTLKLSLCGLLLVIIIATGIWLSSLSRPFNTGAVTIHKLIALAFVVFLSNVIIRLLKETQINSIILLFLIIAGLSIIALFASGALLSIDRITPKIILTIHSLTPIITVISLITAVYLLLKDKLPGT